MPIVGFKCPIHRGDVPFDHFETCDAKGGRPPFSRWLARAIAEKALNDTRHASIDLTVTRTMGCPRAVYIEARIPYTIDPTKIELATRGTELHARAVERMDPERWYTKANDAMRVQLKGELPGLGVVSGEADAIAKDLTEIIDFKFPMDFSVMYRGKKGMDWAKVLGGRYTGKCSVDHAVQLNLLRLLLGEQEWAVAEGYDPETVKLTLEDGAIGKSEGGIAIAVPHIPIEDLVKIPGSGGVPLIEEIVAIWRWMEEEDRGYAGDPATKYEQIAAAIPLVGVTQFNGKRCEGYCAVNSICSALVRKYGDPGVVDVVVEDGEVTVLPPHGEDESMFTCNSCGAEFDSSDDLARHGKVCGVVEDPVDSSDEEHADPGKSIFNSLRR